MSSKATTDLQCKKQHVTALPPTIYGNQPSTNNKLKIALIVSLILVAAVTIALASATIYFFASCSRTRSPSSNEAVTVHTLEKEAEMMNELVRSRRSDRARQRRPGSSTSNRDKSCYSLMTNDSYPAAHITGVTPMQWNQKNVPPSPENQGAADAFGYKSHWVCNKTRGAFVDGGMFFNQTDKKLYVPKCGYYYVSSQMYFKYETRETNKFVRHLMTIDRNCGGQDKLELESLSSLGAIGHSSQTSTYLADIVKICTGGTISVNVPATNDEREPCCPGGRDTITFFSSHLVKESDCEWPIYDRMLNRPPTQQDYDNYYSSRS